MHVILRIFHYLCLVEWNTKVEYCTGCALVYKFKHFNICMYRNKEGVITFKWTPANVPEPWTS